MYFFHGPLLAIKGDVWTQKVVHISQFSKLLFRRRKKRKKILVMIFFWGSPALRMHFSLLQLFLCILDSDWQDAVINYALWFGPRFPQKLFFTKGLQPISKSAILYTVHYHHIRSRLISTGGCPRKTNDQLSIPSRIPYPYL